MTERRDDDPAAAEAENHATVDGGVASLVAVVRRYLPGMAALVGIAVAARIVGTMLPYATPLITAVALGLLLGNLVAIPASLLPGIDTHKLWLEAGIVLMGARISIGTLLDSGVELAVVVVVGVALTVVLAETLGRVVFRVPRKLSSLLAAGAGVCGVSAVVGVAGSISADEEHVAYAAATILLFDVVTLFVYPSLGTALGLGDQVFGIWSGLTMFSTGPVTAAGFAFSETAGQWATVTKLTRNLLLGVLVGGYSLVYLDTGAGRRAFSPGSLWASFPKFILGFFGIMVLASTAIVPPATTAQLTDAYRWLFLVAFVGLGLHVDVAELRTTGIRPIAIVFATLLAVSVVSLVVIKRLFGV